MKTSLLKHCHDVKIRTDLADCGLYVFSFGLYKFMLILLADKKTLKYPHLFDSIKDDLIPFLARKQFKKALNKLFTEAQRDENQAMRRVTSDMKRLKECAQKIELMLNPDYEIKRDQIKVMSYIDSFESSSIYMRI